MCEPEFLCMLGISILSNKKKSVVSTLPPCTLTVSHETRVTIWLVYMRVEIFVGSKSLDLIFEGLNYYKDH